MHATRHNYWYMKLHVGDFDLVCNVVGLHHAYVAVVELVAEHAAAHTNGAINCIATPRLKKYNNANIVGFASFPERPASVII